MNTTTTDTAQKSKASTLVGTVVSDANHKTVVIPVERRFKHPLYGKFIRRSSKMHAHDPDNQARLGDTVEIQECPPISKMKKWRLKQVLVRAN